jgi:hypothetical protein
MLKVYGHWYTSTCDGTGGHESLKPLPPVRLTLTLPGGGVEHLGRFSPGGADMGFATSVRIPSGTRPGTATIRDDGAYRSVQPLTMGSQAKMILTVSL